MKRWKLNRVLSLVMASAIVFGMLPSYALGATQAGSEHQILADESGVYQYATVNKNTGMLEEVGGRNTVSTPGGKVEITERIAPTTLENQFDLTFTVKTRQEVSSEIVAPDMAVVLVMDLSDSMNVCVACNEKEGENPAHGPQSGYRCANDEVSRGFFPMGGKHMCLSCGGWEQRNEDGSYTTDNHTYFDIPAEHGFLSRLAQAQETTYEFIENYATGAGDGKRMVSIVGYSGEGVNNSSAIDVRNISGGWVDATDLNHMHSILFGDQMYTGTGTVTEAGLLESIRWLKDLPKGSGGAPIANTAVILMTDGNPTGAVSGVTYTGKLVAAEEKKQFPENGYLWAMEQGRVIQQTYGAAFYSICYGKGGFATYDGFQWLSAFSTKAYRAEDAEQLKLSFENILNQIELRTKAWKATIPMGPYLTVAKPSENVNSKINMFLKSSVCYYDTESRTIHWNLRADEFAPSGEGENQVYTYTLQVRAILDPTQEGFTKDTYYPANLYSTLEYVFENEKGHVVDENGNLVEDARLQVMPFRVPQVKGVMPVVNYSIHYFQKERGAEAQYVEVTKDAENERQGELKEIIPLPDGYETKYADQNFRFVNGETLALTLDGPNEMNLYYDPITAQVQETHWVKTITKNADGTESESEYETVKSVNSSDCYAGDAYEVTLLDPEAGYVLKKGESSPTKGLKLTEGLNELNYYYTITVDNRPATGVTRYFFTETIWTVDPDTGRFTSTTVGPQQRLEQYPDVSYIGGDKELYAGVKLADSGDWTLEEEPAGVTLAGGETKYVDLYYTRVTGEPTQKASVVVNHVYTTKVITATSSYNEPAGKETEDAVELWLGERYTAEARTDYSGHQDWTCTTADAQRTAVAEEETEYVITLTYTRTDDRRVDTDVVVNHYYVDYLWQVNQDGEAEAVWPETMPEPQVQTVTSNIYVGGSYTAEPMEQNGYEYKAEYSDELTIAQLGNSGKNVIHIYYGKMTEKGESNDASVAVKHIYETWTQRVNAETGMVETVRTAVTEPVDGETIHGLVGEKVDIAPVNDHDGIRYDKVVFPDMGDSTTFPYKLTGMDGTFIIRYRRDVNDLTEDNETYLTVTPKLVTVTTGIDPVTGETSHSESVTEGAAWSSRDQGLKLYATQAYAVDSTDFAQSGYDFSAQRTEAGNGFNYANFRLGAAGETKNVDLYFVRSEDGRGDKVPVRVHHYYELTTHSMVDGVYTTDKNTAEIHDEPVLLYVDQFFTTTDKSNVWPDYTLDETRLPEARIQVGADGLDVSFYYTRTVDQTEGATLTVRHNYTWYNWDGTINRTDSKGGGSESPFYAGQAFTVTPDFLGGALGNESLKSVVWARGGETVELGRDEMNIRLAKGGNEIVLTYEVTLDNRVDATVTVKHSYAVHDTYTDKTTDEGTVVETFKGIDQGAWVDGTFQAKLLLTKGADEAALTYVFTGAKHGELALEEDGDKPGYLTAIKLTGEGSTIEISYLRTIDTTPSKPTEPENPSGGGDSDNYYRVTVQYKEKDTGKTLATAYRSQQIREGRKYDVTAQANQAIGGYSIAQVDGDVTGTIGRNVKITVWYVADANIPETEPPTDPGQTPEPTPEPAPEGGNGTTSPDDEIIIEDNDTPMTELPELPAAEEPALVPEEEEFIIVDSEIPLGNLPQTGSHMAPGATLPLGIMGLALTMTAGGFLLLSRTKKDDQ